MNTRINSMIFLITKLIALVGLSNNILSEAYKATQKKPNTISLMSSKNVVKKQFRSSDEYAHLKRILQHAQENTKSKPLSCEEQEQTYYNNNTTIHPAELESFAFSISWSDPNFDLQNYFDNLNFDSECTGMGGEVYALDIKFKCEEEEEDEIYLENYKFCKPPICSDFEFIMAKSLISQVVGGHLGCNVDVINDVVPSPECFRAMSGFYKNTDLTNYAPETFISRGLSQNVLVSAISLLFSEKRILNH